MDDDTRRWYTAGLKRRPGLHSLKDIDNATDEEVLAAIQESSENQAKARHASGQIGASKRYPSLEELSDRLDKLLAEAAEDEEREIEEARRELDRTLRGA